MEFALKEKESKERRLSGRIPTEAGRNKKNQEDCPCRFNELVDVEN